MTVFLCKYLWIGCSVTSRDYYSIRQLYLASLKIPKG